MGGRRGGKLSRWRHRVHLILEGGASAGPVGATFEYGLVALIVANVIAVALETEPAFAAEWGRWLTYFEIVSVVIFTLEYAARIWCAPEEPLTADLGPVRGRVRFALRPMMIIDLISFLPAYFVFLVPGLDLRMMRLLRLFRLLKITRYSPALQTLGDVVVTESRALFGTVLLLMIAVLFSAAAIHLVEGGVQPAVFGTIPSSMWWAITTLTTVGYGDTVPVTPLGRLVAGTTMIVGLGLFALPVGIMATAFVNAIRRREFVISLGMLSKVPMFEHLDARILGEIMGLLHSQTIKPGEIIAVEGENAAAMYLVIAGEVEAKLPEASFRYGPGDFFGERALLHHSRRGATMFALSSCRLLVLETDDFSNLVKKHPALDLNVRATVARRRKELEAALAEKGGAEDGTDASGED